MSGSSALPLLEFRAQLLLSFAITMVRLSEWNGFEPYLMIIPSNDPVVEPVVMSMERVINRLPVASAKRPVPPVIVTFSSIQMIGGAINVATPVNSPEILSPFAAVNSTIPNAPDASGVTSPFQANVK